MRRLLILLVLVLGFGGPATVVIAPFGGFATAQETNSAPDYANWEKVARRAEIALEDKRASSEALETLRAEIVSWRSTFTLAQGSNSSRISTLQNQIAALGPVPDTEAQESPEITTRRQELVAQLADLEGAALRAKEAFSRADGLIGEIDQVIRDRQKTHLMELGPVPVNPQLWPAAARDLTQSFDHALDEFKATWATATEQKLLRQNAPVTGFFLVVAIVLLLRGRNWVERLSARIQSGTGRAHRRLLGFLVSCGQVILPVIGIIAFAAALFSTGLLGFRGRILVDGLPQVGLAFFVARWLSVRAFPLVPDHREVLPVPAREAAKIRWSATALGVLWGLDRMLQPLAEFDTYSAATISVLQFPLIVLSGLLLYRLGGIFRRGAIAIDTASQTETKFRKRILSITGQFMMAVGIVGPVLALIGYGVAARALVYPAMVSVALLALLTLLSHVVRDIYSVITRGDEERGRNALFPVLISFAMVLASLPLFALIWGARSSDLTEIWDQLSKGFVIGDTRISPAQFMTFALIFALGYMLTKLVQSTLKSTVLPKTKIDPGGQVAIVSGLGYVGIFLASLVAISTAGIDLSSLAIVAGALSVGIGFGLQTIVSNFVSGIILLVERPITEGDWIEVGGNMGYVRDISVRATRIETFDRTDVIVPNSDLVAGTVTNYTRGKLTGRTIISVGVAYGTDTRLVEKVLKDIAQAHPMVSMNPPPSVHFIQFGADSMDFQIRAILRDVNFSLTVKSDINHEIVRRFAEESIEIPFPQRDIWLRNAEKLHPTAEAQPTPQRAPAKPVRDDPDAGEPGEGDQPT